MRGDAVKAGRAWHAVVSGAQGQAGLECQTGLGGRVRRGLQGWHGCTQVRADRT